MLGLAACWLASAAAVGLALHRMSAGNAAEAELQALKSATAQPRQEDLAARRDFTQYFPDTLSGDEVARFATEAAQESNVQLRNVSIEESAVANEKLPFIDIAFELRGTYGSTKEWLNRLSQRFSALALVSLDMRRADAGLNEQDASVDVQSSIRMRLYGRPKSNAAPLPAGS